MTVYLLGAGPGPADLLTLRAARLLAEASVVVHDRLVSPDVLALVNPAAELIDVGKRPGCSNSQALINDLLISLGREHAQVVRLKGGDPFVFGRGGEELLALRDAGIDASVVPGLSSALSAPMAAGIPVTHRGLSQGIMVVTGHGEAGARVDFTTLALPNLSLVILMGVARRASIAEELMSGGLDPSTPVAAVQSAWSEEQQVARGELSGLGQLDIESPAVIVIGPVAALELGIVTEIAASYA
ncbi:MAG: uroporphyrinogen-III C-methyltransferase [Actinobacteria bacterium]|nr:uroporphyrinogen-III C-methyltransferase [Actinomycetota bacterium]